MKGDKSDPHEVIPTSFNSYSILKDHFNTFKHLPLGNYHVATRSKTKDEGTQLPKVHGVDKVVNKSLKPETQVKRKGIFKPIPVKPGSVCQLERIILPYPYLEKDREEQVLESN